MRLYACCKHCPPDVDYHRDNPADSHDEPCTLCLFERHTPMRDQWEPLYRAEKRRADAAEAEVAAWKRAHSAAVAKLAEVRALHRPNSWADHLCECGQREPCATRRALDH